MKKRFAAPLALSALCLVLILAAVSTVVIQKEGIGSIWKKKRDFYEANVPHSKPVLDEMERQLPLK